MTREGRKGITAKDLVVVYPCKSLHSSVKQWLSRPTRNAWPTENTKTYIENSRCYVAPVSCRGSVNEGLEWRISTSEAERCLMFQLNITQIRVYVLMKMLLKEHINAGIPDESRVSSYMCKTVLLHCVELWPPSHWLDHNVLLCLTYSLHVLRYCILNEHCAHYIIHTNNLMFRRFTATAKHQLICNIGRILQDILHNGIFAIKTDNLAVRLVAKVSVASTNFLCHQTHDDQTVISKYLLLNTARAIQHTQVKICEKIFQYNCVTKFEKLIEYMQILFQIYRRENPLERSACTLLAPVLCTHIGSVLASASVHAYGNVALVAQLFFHFGFETDVASSRLKLATVFYCSGDMNRADIVLKEVKMRYRFDICEPVCSCEPFAARQRPPPTRLHPYSDIRNVKDIKTLTASCVIFLPNEIIPRELQYEMFRSTPKDRKYVGRRNWMDWAVVDALPYLYFLQYKTYRQLRRHADQQIALDNLMWTIDNEPNLFHRETALNLLGQCLEEENRTNDALKCYRKSLKVRQRNNVAVYHICRLLHAAVNS